MIDERPDWYDELKDSIFKNWSCEQPQIPLTKEQFDNLPKPTYIEIGEWNIQDTIVNQLDN